MSKRKRRSRVDASGVPGQAESHLLPGSAQRQAMLERQKEREAEKQEQLELQAARQAQAQTEAAPTVGKAYELPVSVAVRKYMDFMKKNGLVKKARSIIEKGLGRKVSRKDFDDELYDPGVTVKSFIHDAVIDHRGELSERMSMPVSDTNGDHVVDGEDDAIPTPGMRRMARYM